MSTNNSNKKLLDEISDFMRRFHYFIHTERTYCDWVRQFVKFHQMQTREALFVEPEKSRELSELLLMRRL